MGYYDHDDFAFTTPGDLVMDTDPLDNGDIEAGWDLMMASKYARNVRRGEMQEDGTHPNSEFGTLKDFYLETLAQIYPNLSGPELENMVETWGYIDSDQFESLRQTIRDRCKTTNEDWLTYPEVGADMETHVGEPMNIVTAEDLRQKIIHSLTRDDFVMSMNLLVKYFKADESTLLFSVEVLVGAGQVIREVIPFSFVEGPFLMLKEAEQDVHPVYT